MSTNSSQVDVTLFPSFLDIFIICVKIARKSECRSAFKILTNKPIRRRFLGRHRWKDNFTMDLKGIGVNVGSWIDTAQDRDYWRVLP